MSVVELRPQPITASRFAAYGDVIQASGADMLAMNEARFERFDDLARIDIDGPVATGIVRSRTATVLPYHVEMLERHPFGSQAFVPLSRFPFVIVVAPPAEVVETADICAFVVGPGQGINYLRGTWHMPLIALDAGQTFLVIDRSPSAGPNCEELMLAEPVMLCEP
jgi:ureidoglycolate lyase